MLKGLWLPPRWQSIRRLHRGQKASAEEDEVLARADVREIGGAFARGPRGEKVTPLLYGAGSSRLNPPSAKSKYRKG